MPTPLPVRAYRKVVQFPSFAPLAPDRNPMFLEKRVYQGSSGRVYPLPFTDRVEDRPRLRAWDAIFIENEFLQVMILPALGGRIHRMLDRTNGYDVIYYQPVIKPALVGLAGPWASGGIEFNWPQHHRPSTFMPADAAIERHPDGSVTVWLSEHDPMARMKGMHGVRLHPDKSCLELVARVYNRTTDVQTFLWWANAATRAHEQYQSFFPPDATCIADHAKRATGSYPLCDGRYYGVDYATRAREGLPPGEFPRQYPPGRYARNDLSWYANIPVPTSYMCTASAEDFAGGYDHRAQAGLVHFADHHISPGKKQWTWGNHEFGYAWDRNLTEPDARGEYAPYIELMSGVYTDNQPDFSYLQPGETKAWSQYWYPIRAIGPAQHANLDAALSLQVTKRRARLGVAVTARHPGAVVQLERDDRVMRRWRQTLAPDQPFVTELALSPRTATTSLTLRVRTRDGRELIAYAPKKHSGRKSPAPATEPPPPAEVAGNDELFVIGLHLEQYRHATRSPVDYWREALRRDAGDSRAHLALGRWHLRRGELADAESHLHRSIARLTSRNSNPYDGEAYYQLGRCLVFQSFCESKFENQKSKISLAYAAFYKATWNQAWQAAGYHALAEIDAGRGDWAKALDHVERSLRLNLDNLRARNLKVLILRRLGRAQEAAALLRATLALDPLDWWARDLHGEKIACDTQVRLDLALDYARGRFLEEAITVLKAAKPEPRSGTEPLVHYYLAWLNDRQNDLPAARASRSAAARAKPDYCFPARLEEIAILTHAIAANPRDARATFYLANLYYDRRRHREAIPLWERAVRLEPRNAIAWRNLGIGYCNILHQPTKALRAYDAAFRANPRDARLLFERDQLWKRRNVTPVRRLRELLKHRPLVDQRDDLSVELCALFNQTGAPHRALAIISSRKFQPWEGGEGQALGQHVRTHLMLGRKTLSFVGPALAAGPGTWPADERQPYNKAIATAIAHFETALTAPENLGEAKHLLANQSDIHFWLGEALAAAGNAAAAHHHWTIAAEFKGDFQTMSIRPYSEMTYYSALALKKLDRRGLAKKLLRGLLAYAQQLAQAPAKIDYFATSLPTMLLFDEDLPARQQTTALFLEAQARLGLGQTATARRLLRTVLRRDHNHALAADLVS